MATLTETAYYSRIAIKYGGIILAVLIIGRFSLGALITAWKNANPDPPPPPTVAFGPLPEISFPSSTRGTVTYRLETPTGNFPAFPDRAEVFFMPAERPNLLALDRATTEAAGLGFKNTPIKRSDTLYRWQEQSPLPSTLDMFIYEGNFTMNVNWSSNPSFLSGINLPDEAQAISQVKSYLSRANLLASDLSKGEANITYLEAQGNVLSQTISLSEADFLQVDLYRQPIEEYSVYTLDPEQGVVQAIVSGNQELGRIVSVIYNYYPVDYENGATYPLKSPGQAWQELTSGQGGYIARLDPGINTVTIRRVELGYLDTYEAQKYLQPVYIFRGDDNAIAYVPAATYTIQAQ